MTTTEAWGKRWTARRYLSTSELASWDAEAWQEWFSDGLRVWFSNFPTFDRALAFAPLRITVGREVMAEALATYLERFYEDGPKQEAEPALDLIAAIEDGALQCMKQSVLLDCKRADFLLEVFEALETPSLAKLARMSLQTLPASAFADEDAEDYLSRLTYIVLDNNAVQEGDFLQSLLEERLARCENFRPALSYSLQLSDDNVLLSLERFFDLVAQIEDIDSPDIWREVADEFNNRFSTAAVENAVRHATGVSLMADISSVGGLVPAAHLAQFYPGADAGGLPDPSQDHSDRNTAAMREREIEFDLV